MGIVSALFEVIMSVFGFIIDTVMDLLSGLVSPRRKTKYDADWGTVSAGATRKKDVGFRVASWYNSKKAANSHLLVAAGTGGGKSTNVVHRILLEPADNCAYVVLDTNGDLSEQTSGYLHQVKRPIYYFDVEKEYSIRLNFIKSSKTLEDLHKNVHVLMANSYEGAHDYWFQSGENLIYFSASVLWKFAEPQYVNIANVIHMLLTFSFAPQKVDRWIVEHCDEQTVNQYKSLCATPQKTLQCSISTALNALHIYTTAKVQSITNDTTFSLQQLRDEGGILYLTASAASAHHYRSIYGIIIQNFFNEILQTPVSEKDNDVVFLLDEIGNITIPGLPQFLSLCRKRKVSVATLWQDLTGQIVKSYGKDGASTILANSAVKAFLPGAKPAETCAMLERLLGKFNYEEDHQVKSRELLTAQEIFQTKDILLLDNNKPPLRIKPAPFFENKTLLKRSQLPPYIPTASTTLPSPTLLDFS